MTRYCYTMSGRHHTGRPARAELVLPRLDTVAASRTLGLTLTRLGCRPDRTSLEWFWFTDTDAEGFIVHPETSS